MSHIHGEEVDFREDTHEARKLLEHPESGHVARAYFEQAQKDGTAHFYAGGDKYDIRLKKGEEGGKDSFSVHRHY